MLEEEIMKTTWLAVLSLLSSLGLSGCLGAESSATNQHIVLKLKEGTNWNQIVIIASNVGDRERRFTDSATSLWCPAVWFVWRVDGKPAEYVSRYDRTLWPLITKTLRPHCEEPLCAADLTDLFFMNEDSDGTRHGERAISGNTHFVVEVLPSLKWGTNTTVKAAKIECRSQEH